MTQMQRVSREQAAAMRLRLSVWQPYRSMHALLSEMAEPHGFYAASQRIMQFWREAHCACKFAEINGLEEVRICEIDPPDFQLRSAERVISCELVEIRDPNSRTGDEFDAAAQEFNAGRNAEVIPFDTEAHLAWLRERLDTSIARKAAKRYDRNIVLAVFVHAWIFDGQRLEADRTIFNTVVGHLDAFAEIWVLASGRLLSFSAKGHQSGYVR